MDPSSTKKFPHISRSLTYHNHSPNKPSFFKRLAADGPSPAAKPIPSASSSSSSAVVLYTTSLRSIRRTHLDCCHVRSVLRGFRVAVDERDVSMDSSYRRELQSLLEKDKGPAFSLPQLFVKGRRVGGPDEVRRLHEAGELSKVLEGVRRVDPAFVCGGCGGARFVPCLNCCGSRKIFVEDERRMRRCEECNENGLVRCPNCSAPF